MTKNLTFDNEMKSLSLGVYKDNKNSIPKDWVRFSERDNESTGFHAETFYKKGTVVISMRGTDPFSYQDIILNDMAMGTNNLPIQYIDAINYYNEIQQTFQNSKIVFTGHSLGGSLAQLMGNLTGNEAVTFNAYGVGNLLNGNINYENSKNIRNYGNAYDTTFYLNLRHQLGESYIIFPEKYSNNSYETSFWGLNHKWGLKPRSNHKIENMGNIKNSIEYINPNDLGIQTLKAGISYDIDLRDIDDKRIITNEEIKQMSNEEFSQNENFINQQLMAGNIMTEMQAKEQLETGNLIWVSSYTRADGTEVKGYYRRK
mgnify:FL=1